MKDEIGTVPLTILYDMGWNKYSSGRVFDVLSCHGYFIGCATGIVIQMGFIKKCSICKQSSGSNVEVPNHICVKTFSASGTNPSDSNRGYGIR